MISKPKKQLNKDKPCKVCDKGKRLPSRTICYKCLRKQERAKKIEQLARKKERKINSKGYKESEIKILKKKCWKLMSEYTRRRDKGICFTCLIKKHWKEQQAGHRYHGRLDLDFRNINCQCVHCNKYLHGNLGAYERRQIEENGIEWVKQLERDSWAKGNDYTKQELLKIEKELEKLLEEPKASDLFY